MWQPQWLRWVWKSIGAKVLGEIATKMKNFSLLQESKNLQKRLEQLDWEWKDVIRRLWEIDLEMVYKDYGFHVVYVLFLLAVSQQLWECNVLHFYYNLE